MGFLLGAFGKQMAGKRVRSLQSRMMRVQSQMRTAARNVEQIEKQINAQQRNMKNQLSQQSIFMQQAIQSGANAQSSNYLASLLQDAGLDMTKMNEWTDDQKHSYTNVMSMYSSTASQINSYASSTIQSVQQLQAQQQAQMEQTIEWMKETMLEPAKDEEDELQTEKDSLESQIQLAQQDYEACKEMEKQGAKDFAPNYTGQ